MFSFLIQFCSIPIKQSTFECCIKAVLLSLSLQKNGHSVLPQKLKILCENRRTIKNGTSKNTAFLQTAIDRLLYFVRKIT
uniref:Uncharacterized protein n=1 Tax=Parascaris univalens TaxID=6257 RepID=A0A915BYU2_PARUN